MAERKKQAKAPKKEVAPPEAKPQEQPAQPAPQVKELGVEAPPPYVPRKEKGPGALTTVYRSVGRIFPPFLKNKINFMLHTSGNVDTIPEEWLGAAMLVSFFYAVIFTVLPFLLFGISGIPQIFSGFLIFLVVFMLYYLALYRAMLKAQEVEGLHVERLLFLNKRFFVRLFQSLSKCYPWKFRNHIRQLIIFTGNRWKTPEEWLGLTFLLSLLYAFIASIIAFGFFYLPIYVPPIVFFGAFGLGLFLNYMMLYYQTENRRKVVEYILPDFLQLIAANIRAGMTPFAALRASSRSEFGPLEREVEYATAKSLGTESFTDALREVSTTINSTVLQRVIGLFSSGLKSGGTLSALLENASQDISQTQELNRQLVTSTKMYTMFILFNIAVGSPLMLAISLQFVGMVQSYQDESAGENILAEFGTGLASGNIGLTSDFLFKASIIIIVITCFIASGFMGVINEGSIRNGFRYFIPLALVSVVLYLVFRQLVSNIIGSMV